MIQKRKESFQNEEELFEMEKRRILRAEYDLNIVVSNIIES